MLVGCDFGDIVGPCAQEELVCIPGSEGYVCGKNFWSEHESAANCGWYSRFLRFLSAGYFLSQIERVRKRLKVVTITGSYIEKKSCS